MFWSVAVKKVRRTCQLSMSHTLRWQSRAFCFLIQMFNVPAPGGMSGHAVGAAVVAILLGAWDRCHRAFGRPRYPGPVFGDGGITALGANCFNMAVLMPFVSYAFFRLIARGAPGGRRVFVAAFVAGYAGLCAAATGRASSSAYSRSSRADPTAGRVTPRTR